MTSLFAVVRCILYPGTQIVVVSGTLKQANEVLEKIENIFMKANGWGSENLRLEIEECKIGQNDSRIVFKNGSYIKTATSTDNARSKRANVLIVDECRMVKLDIINTVLRKFLTAERQPRYLNNPKYKHLKERNKEIYMTSAYYKDHWLFAKVQDYCVNLVDDTKKYFVCGLPYQISIKEGLLNREAVEDEMSESTFDEIKQVMEMDALFYGDTDGSFFSFDNVSSCRKLKTAIYPTSMIDKRKYKIPDLLDNERRILSVDIALMASGKHDNDATCIIVNRAIPTNRDSFIANIVYTENYEGLNTNDLALIIRKMYADYKCTDLVIDTSGAGIGVYDALIRDQVDPETGELYEALSCCNDKDMAARCKVANAPEVIWSIKASSSLNSKMCVTLRSGFKEKKINLLVSELSADERLKKEVSGYSRLPVEEKTKYKMPYVNTTLLVNELTKLEYESRGNDIKIKEKSGMRKDRYSSLMYNYWVQCQLERELLHAPKNEFTLEDYARDFRRLRINKKPISY